MNLETDRPTESPERMLELVKSEIRQNYEFALFSILPGLSSDLRAVVRFGKQLGVDAEKAETFVKRLIGAGLWKVTDGKVTSNFELLELGDISVKEYLAVTLGIVAQLSDAKSHIYDTHSMVTNRRLVRAFVGKVNQAMKELHQQSLADPEKECIFSWSHTGVIEIEKREVAGPKEGEA